MDEYHNYQKSLNHFGSVLLYCQSIVYDPQINMSQQLITCLYSHSVQMCHRSEYGGQKVFFTGFVACFVEIVTLPLSCQSQSYKGNLFAYGSRLSGKNVF